MLAGPQRGLDRASRGAFLAADQLDENVDRRLDGEPLRLIEPGDACQFNATRSSGASAR